MGSADRDADIDWNTAAVDSVDAVPGFRSAGPGVASVVGVPAFTDGHGELRVLSADERECPFGDELPPPDEALCFGIGAPFPAGEPPPEVLVPSSAVV